MPSRAGLENNPLPFLKSTVAAVLVLLCFLCTVSSVVPVAHAAPASISTHIATPSATQSGCIDANHSLHGRVRNALVPPHEYTYAAQVQLSTPDGSHTSGLAMRTSPGCSQQNPPSISIHPIPYQRTDTEEPLKETIKRDTEVIFLVRRKSIAAKIRDAFHKLGHKIKHAFQKVGHAIKTAAQKVGHFFKTTGAKIAKVALKIVATVGKVVGKVVGFIPGAKGIGKAIDGASEGLNKASDAIHAHIGGKLGKAMQKMDKAQKIVGYIP